MPPGRKKGFIPYNKHEWSEYELTFIRENFHTMTNRELAKALGLKLTILRTQCYSMGLKRMEMEYWTERQIDFLKQHYQTIGDVELADIYNEAWPKNKVWTKQHIEKKRSYLKLNRTKEQIRTIKDRNVLYGCFAAGQKRTWETRGITPVGERRVWKDTETGNPFVVIKLKDGFIHYKRWLWEQIYGPIPEGMLVEVKDKDPLNVVPGNLFLATRSEHCLLNTIKSSQGLSDRYVAGILTHKKPELREAILQYPELIELKRTQLQLKRQIRERRNIKENGADEGQDLHV